jgi:hypothetical protein
MQGRTSFASHIYMRDYVVTTIVESRIVHVRRGRVGLVLSNSKVCSDSASVRVRPLDTSPRGTPSNFVLPPPPSFRLSVQGSACATLKSFLLLSDSEFDSGTSTTASSGRPSWTGENGVRPGKMEPNAASRHVRVARSTCLCAQRNPSIFIIIIVSRRREGKKNKSAAIRSSTSANERHGCPR